MKPECKQSYIASWAPQRIWSQLFCCLHRHITVIAKLKCTGSAEKWTLEVNGNNKRETPALAFRSCTPPSPLPRLTPCPAFASRKTIGTSMCASCGWKFPLHLPLLRPARQLHQRPLLLFYSPSSPPHIYHTLYINRHSSTTRFVPRPSHQPLLLNPANKIQTYESTHAMSEGSEKERTSNEEVKQKRDPLERRKKGCKCCQKSGWSVLCHDPTHPSLAKAISNSFQRVLLTRAS